MKRINFYWQDLGEKEAISREKEQNWNLNLKNLSFTSLWGSKPAHNLQLLDFRLLLMWKWFPLLPSSLFLFLLLMSFFIFLIPRVVFFLLPFYLCSPSCFLLNLILFTFYIQRPQSLKKKNILRMYTLKDILYPLGNSFSPSFLSDSFSSST